MKSKMKSILILFVTYLCVCCECFSNTNSKTFSTATKLNQNNKYSLNKANRITSITTKSTTTKLNGFFGDFFKTKSILTKELEVIVPKYDPVTIAPDFRIAGTFLLLGILLDTIPYIQLTLGPILTALGILFLVQTLRLRFVFDEDNNLELQTTTSSDKSSGENVIVGGANKWDCNTIVNYDFFPKGWIDSSPTGPILVYFKETQTPKDTWDQGPGKSANDPEKIRLGEAIAGQVHFFPAICNANQIRDEFEKRNCRKPPLV